MNRSVFAVVIALVAVAGLGYTILFNDDDPALLNAGPATEETTPTTAEPAPEETAPEATAPAVDPATPENFGPAGTLTDLDGWLQTDQISLEAFSGQVRIVQFWTFGCSNCKATIPTLQHLYATYEPQGLEIIGVHAPEFDFEADPANIAQAAIDLGVTWPIALDTNKTNFREWQGSRRFWPRTFVLDANGDIRFDHIGEGQYEELESTVSWLIANGGA